jgi:predicted small metal-binding protein
MHMTKETGRAKQMGIVALLKLMTCYQNIACTRNSSEEKDDGYWVAIDYLTKPILDMKQTRTNVTATTSEFRFRCGHLFTVCDYHSAETMVSKLWDHAKGMHDMESSIRAGLACVVDACAKKHGNSNLVAQID